MKRSRFVGLTLAIVLAISFHFLTSLGRVAVHSQGVPIRAVALVMDGSSSIDANDFALQKEGINLALQDPQILPRDGTIAVSVIQYASTTTRIEVPYRVIRSASDVSDVVAQVSQISQIRGSTNPGDGINAAMTQFQLNASVNDNVIVCLSTDGLPNSGSSITSALTYARNAPVPLDSFTVVAVEDPPNYYADDFHEFYDDLVFGGGAVAVVENSVEFANVIGATCFIAEPVELVGLEAVQTIQSWDDSVQLIKDKTTYVRAHFQPSQSADPTRVTARLHARRNGSSLPGSPITAINTGGAIDALPNAGAHRGEFDGSLNFRLPHEWLDGTIELEVERLGGSLTCQDAADTPNDCKVSVTFNTVDELEVRLISVSWTDDSNTTHTPSNGDLYELAERLRAIYPIAYLDWDTSSTTYRGGEVDSNTDLWLLNAQLLLRRFADRCWIGCERLYYGVLVDAQVGGLANDIPGTVSSGNLPDKFTNPLDYGRNRHAHEIGHTLGRRHVTYCGAADPQAPAFPYTDTIGGQVVATLGPMRSGEDAMIYGLDTHRLVVVDPHDNYELMSYCGAGNPDGWRWISKFTYDAVKDAINNRFNITASPPTTNNGAPENYMILRGIVDLQAGAVSFLPFGIIDSSSVPPSAPNGDYGLVLKDSTGAVLRQIEFQVMEMHADWPSSDPGVGAFLVPVPADSNVTTVQVVGDSGTLGEITATPNAPMVEVLFPNGGENLSDPTVTLRWNGNDPDSDMLTYLVQYSRDNGASWQTLVADWPGESYDVNLNTLGQTNEGLIRVMVSDGFHATTDTSDSVFSAPNQAPQVTIVSPHADEQFIGVQSIFFEVSALDLEDGHLAGDNIMWSSDLDGTIGTGELLVRDAASLSEGAHMISVTATDSGGQSTTVSVPIFVYRLAPPSSQTVALSSGWNLVSLPLNPSTADIEQALASIARTYNVILSFEGGALTYDPSLPQFSTLRTIDGEHGYWIRMMHDATLTVPGQRLTPDTPITLEQGWNLVSYLAPNPMSVEVALTSISGKYTTVLGYDGGATAFYTAIPPHLNTLRIMEPGKGYWLYLKESAVLQYPSALLQSSLNRTGTNLTNRPQRSSDITPTYEWINVYSLHSTYNSHPLPLGSIITAVGEDGRKLGEAAVHQEGSFGVLAIYRDDPYTPELDGARPGEQISFLINGQPAVHSSEAALRWTSNGDLMSVDLAAIGPTFVTHAVYLPFATR